VVVDNGSVHSVAAELRALSPAVTVLELPANLGAAARNIGVDASGTPYVAFCDDDITWEDGSLRRAAELLDAHPDVAVVVARVMDQRTGAADPICEVLETSPLRSGNFPGPALVGFMAGASVVRRNAYDGAGGFSERVGVGGEEELLAIDLLVHGWSLVYSDELTAWHSPGERDLAARRVRTVRNQLWTIWLRYPLVAAVASTVRVVRLHRKTGIAALRVAVREGGWVIRARRPMPASTLATIRSVAPSRPRRCSFRRPSTQVPAGSRGGG